ncbi:MAG: hypothetical protein GX596_06065 [Propionibacterium sp.]|nr:hypothetical protein [Propionibacterium sp.]
MSDAKTMAAPLVGTGLLMTVYLVLRPYGDHDGATTIAAAGAFASGWWIVAHLAGALALVSFARLALRLHDLAGSPLTRAARSLGLAGAVLVLPYYGAETFALHALGRRALSGDPAALALVPDIRDGVVAMITFGLGLLLLAASAVTAAIAWRRRTGSNAAWPLAVLIVAFLPQFFLPPAGRVAYGLLVLPAALWWLHSARDTTSRGGGRGASGAYR